MTVQSRKAQTTFFSGVTSISWTTLGQSGRGTPPTQLRKHQLASDDSVLSDQRSYDGATPEIMKIPF
jgi:hypothetical protein